METKRNSFKGSLGFVLAAAGSAVGLGNIWRFPYLAAKDGGGLFLIVYLALALTFGYTMLATEISLGRMTKQGPLTAYGKVKKGWDWLGVIACLVPVIIMPYYSVIGGWVVKYFGAFVTGTSEEAAGDDYFGGFISSTAEPIILTVVFLLVVSFIVFRGVNKGIENSSKIIMPILIVLVVGIAFFSLTIKHTDAEGVTRTGLDGMKVYLIPNFDGLTVGKFFRIVVDAMGQLFFSISVAMGIMVAYGSYVKDDANLGKSINQIEIFDTLVAVFAGAMIIPAVVCFMGEDSMSAGPSLMFVSLPKVFAAMGGAGKVIGALFFAMVLFAALTSAVSVMEAVVASLMDRFKWSRAKACLVETVVALIGGVFVCLGYNKLFFNVKLPTGDSQLLDIMDYVSNSVFMPIVAIGTCILFGWILKPKFIADEVEKGGNKFGRKRLYYVMIKFIAPVLLTILFLISTGILKL